MQNDYPVHTRPIGIVTRNIPAYLDTMLRVLRGEFPKAGPSRLLLQPRPADLDQPGR